MLTSEPLKIQMRYAWPLSRYAVTKDFKIVSYWFSRPRIINGSHNGEGYVTFGTLRRDDGGRASLRRSVMICEAFHGSRPQGMVVRHLDGSRDNDVSENLVWGTELENSRDKIIHNTQPLGEKCNWAKLTQEDVEFIRENPR